MEKIEYLFENIEKSLKILKNIKQKIYPLNEENYLDLCENNITYLDTIAYRFSKIQSILGEKLFVKVLEYLEIDVNDKSFIEILALLERERILSIDKWRRLRIIRNTISHDYPEEIEFIVKAINEIFENIDYLENVYEKLKGKYEIAKKIKTKQI
jgi:hypothetical protein